MAREYRLYRVKTPYGTAPWQVDSGQKKRSLYPIVEEVTTIDSRDVEPLVEALRQILDPAETEDMSSSAWIDWAKRTARGALQPFTPENNDPRENA